MKKYLFILFALICLQAQAVISSMHINPESYSPGKDLELKLEIIQSSSTILNVNIQYRQAGEATWQLSPMRTDEPGLYNGYIPRGVLSDSQIQYRFEFEVDNGPKEYLPDASSLKPFFSLNPERQIGALSQAFIRLNYESSISSDDDYLLVVSFLEIADDLEPGSLKVYVGERDVTYKVQQSGGTLLYRENRPQPGIVKAYVTARLSGKELRSDTWITEVIAGSGKPRTPFIYSGSINMAANAYSSSDKALSFGNSLSDFASWGDFQGRYGIAQVSTNLYFSSLEEGDKQPVNRYNIGIKVPILEIIAGDSSPSLSEYTLNGKNIRGLHTTLDAKHLRLHWIHGESIRQIKAPQDSLHNIGEGSTFRQEAIGAKLSLGEENGFSFNIIASRHRDIISSLPREYYMMSATDSLNYRLKAQDAAVAAVDLRINVPEQDVLMGFEIAGSLLNKNTIPGAFSNDTLADYGIDLPISPVDISDLFVINNNLEPFGLSSANLAWKLYVRSFMLNNLIGLDYQEIGSSFTSLGSYTPLQDARIINITDQFVLGRFLVLSGAFNLTKDNLKGFNAISNTFQTIQAQALLRVPNWPHLKAALNLDNSKNKKRSDVELENFQPYKAERKSLNLGIGYNIVQIPYVPTQIDISYRFGDDYRKNRLADDSFDLLGENKHNGLNISMINRFEILPLRTYLSYNDASLKDELQNLDKKNSRIYGKAEYSLLKDILRPYISFSTNSLSGDQDQQSQNQFSLGLSSYPYKNLNVTADYALQSYKNDSDSLRDYNTSTFRFLVNQRF